MIKTLIFIKNFIYSEEFAKKLKKFSKSINATIININEIEDLALRRDIKNYYCITGHLSIVTEKFDIKTVDIKKEINFEQLIKDINKMKIKLNIPFYRNIINFITNIKNNIITYYKKLFIKNKNNIDLGYD